MLQFSIYATQIPHTHAMNTVTTRVQQVLPFVKTINKLRNKTKPNTICLWN